MAKVTRITYNKNLNQGKYNHLNEVTRGHGKKKYPPLAKVEVLWKQYGLTIT